MVDWLAEVLARNRDAYERLPKGIRDARFTADTVTTTRDMLDRHPRGLR